MHWYSLLRRKKEQEIRCNSFSPFVFIKIVSLIERDSEEIRLQNVEGG